MLKPHLVIWTYCLLLPSYSVMAANLISYEVQSEMERVQFRYLFGQNAALNGLLDITLPAPDNRVGDIRQQLLYITSSTKRDFGQIAPPTGEYQHWGVNAGVAFNIEPYPNFPQGKQFTHYIAGFSARQEVDTSTIPFKGTGNISYYDSTGASTQMYQMPSGFPGGVIKGKTSDYQYTSCYSSDDWWLSCGIPIDAMKGSKWLIAELNIGYAYRYDSDEQGLLDEASLWLDNVTLANFRKEIRKWLNPEDSSHIDQRKKVIIRINASSGVRGSVSFDGVMMTTASPSVLSYDITLPDVSVLNLPIAFTENNSGASLDVYFDETLLYSGVGDNFTLGELAIVPLDIQPLMGQTGTLKILLNTASTESAQLFIPERISTEDIAITNYAPVPEPETYALMLAGLGLVGFVARQGRKQI